MRGLRYWRWHLDEVSVKIHGEAEEGNSRIVGGVIMSSVEMALLSERLREDNKARIEATRLGASWATKWSV